MTAIGNQTRTVDQVVVVDNEGPSSAVSEPASDGVRVLRMSRNTGPAGGYAAGLDDFLDGDAAWAWLMDDDCEPAPDALERQLLAARAGAGAVMATMVDKDSGEVTNTQGWCAVLVARTVVEAVGVPDPELFWWTEDTEYLQWRIPRAGFEVIRAPDARVQVSRSRADLEKPPWKYYYESRNQVYYRLHTQKVGSPAGRPRHLRARVRYWRAVRSVGKLAARAVVKETNGRLPKVVMVGKGALDGARGRLGTTVNANSADRPIIRS